ncbi:anaerobic ribonucleoside-triphosphate reductase [Desulfoplanes formicivorans]|uniref:Ribonucleoside triphosphate reductase n=1 Tax=Desulfoplanes formicivorans TaxID=1592317 RepID=A0A194AGZ0_9BACT|nr:anaerobic ribonucleoside-triphosphate reductase [Desulfoplanes formicivorans]GAU08351.1 ribonucleoside triphosphate reductase [Desulfoplanes formicivorans]
MPEKIQKRDGRLETWSVDRIAKAIFKSLNASGIRDPLLARRLAQNVEEHLADVAVPEQEDVQDMVEQVLMEARLYSVAKKYILYREKRRGIRSQDMAFLDVRDAIDTYVHKGDAQGRSTVRPHSFRGLSRHLAGAVQQRYALEQYPEEIRMAHENGYLHIHELAFGMAGHSAGWDLQALLGKGFGFRGVPAFGPAEHLDAALGQVISFLGAMGGEWAATQFFGHFDTMLAPFVRAENLDYDRVHHLVRQFVLALNSFSQGRQRLPMCSLGLDGDVPPWLAQTPVGVPAGCQKTTYGEYQREVAMLNKALGEVLLAGDHLGQPLESPVLSHDLVPGFSWESESGSRIVRLAALGRCVCLRVRGGGDAGEQRHREMAGTGCDCSWGVEGVTGAIGAISLNLPKLAFLAGRESDFLDLIGEYAEYARQALEFKRKFIVDYTHSGMFPYSQHYLENGLTNHCSLLTVVGGHEACMNLLGAGIATPEGIALMVKVIDRLAAIASDCTRETGHPYAVTTMTNNRACYRLAEIDESLYTEIVFSSNGRPHYTNGMGLPPGHGLSLDAEIEHQAQLASRFPGGAVLDLALPHQTADTLLPTIFRKLSRYSGISLVRIH